MFPNLIHLDDTAVTENERKSAQKIYPRSLLDRLVSQAHQNLPRYLRTFSEKVSELMAAQPPLLFAPTIDKNLVV